MLSVLMARLNEVFAASPGSMLKVPATSSNRPKVQLSPRCEILKVAAVCMGSNS